MACSNCLESQDNFSSSGHLKQIPCCDFLSGGFLWGRVDLREDFWEDVGGVWIWGCEMLVGGRGKGVGMFGIGRKVLF